VRRGVVMMKQPGVKSSNVFTQSQQKNPEFTVWPVGNGASRYHNFCIYGGTSFGFHFVCEKTENFSSITLPDGPLYSRQRSLTER
jgi:hypothetical protein